MNLKQNSGKKKTSPFYDSTWFLPNENQNNAQIIMPINNVVSGHPNHISQKLGTKGTIFFLSNMPKTMAEQ